MYDVMHVTSVHPALDSRIFYRQARTSAQHGFKTALVGPHGNREHVDGVDVIPIRKSPVRLIRRLVGPWSVLRAVLKHKARIVHFHDPELIPIGYVLQVLGYKVVYDVHEYYSVVQSNRLPAGLLRSVARYCVSALVERMPCALFSGTVFPTNKLREAIGSRSRSVSFVNLLPRSLIPKCPAVSQKNYDIIFLGTISPFRAGPLMEMMDLVLEQRPSSTLLMLGVKKSTVEWMKANAPSARVLSAITFHSRVPHADVYGLISQARVGFNYHPMEPQFVVAIPMKIYEYMACRLPTVTTLFPEVGEQFENGEEVVMLEGDDQAVYASAVLDLLRDERKAESVGNRGWQAVHSRVNWDVSEAPKLKQFYDKLLGN